MLSWDDFRYIKAIAEARSLNGAAEALNVNHSTVFRRLGQIEKLLGSQLFERGRAGYALTPSGEDMVALAARIGEDITSFERKVTGQDLRPSGELRITTNDMVLIHLLTDVLIGFRKLYPEIVIEIVVSNTLLNLTRRDADIAVRAGSKPPGTMSGRRIAKCAWAVFGAAAAHQQPFKPDSDATRFNWISFSDHMGLANVAKWLKAHAVGADRIVYKVDTMLGMAEAVGGDVGLAALPCFVGNSVPGLKRLTEPLPELEGELWIVTHPDLSTSARVRAFVDYCTKEISKRRNLLECLD
jgi:DNA-binding transcriptional LysR family regulator